MQANHAAPTLWDKSRSHEMDTTCEGAVDRKNFEIVTDRIISRYMNHPTYYKIDSQLIFSKYELGHMIPRLGGIEQSIINKARFDFSKWTQYEPL